MSKKRFFTWLKRLVSAGLAVILLFFAAAFAFPSLQLAQKACGVLQKAEAKAFVLTHKTPELEFHGNGNTTPVFDTSKQRYAEQVPVLMYHYVVPKAFNKEPDNNSMINLESFEAGMKYLYDNGYYTATLSELEDYLHGYIQLPEKTVVLTFDDGYENNYIYAYPILKKYGLHAALFIIGSRVQEHAAKDFKPDKSSYLSQEQLDAASDVFEYHSHTYDLHKKETLFCGKQEALTRDTDLLQKDIGIMREHGYITPYFAYPFGSYDAKTVYYLQKHGYRMAFTVKQGFVKPGDAPLELNRLTVTSSTDMELLLKTGDFKQSVKKD
ncbi:polysaccharide deacetylase family protein [Paenibacillus sp. GCM10012307]|uniref:Polysaccharide deacetylase family protein n=1 Tax=Paenibacillus roseus TaxID=2798579 RepID=A0A934J635_9BACL|nr:polysaccharide deacetylase family protein [Paenibacillus roseus]MBJ6361446.1 polysaccharide deacetylase family protein [Paenibacillus roseus]